VGSSVLEKTLARWAALDKKYNLDTSSLILTALAPPNQPSDLPWLAKSGIKWDGKPEPLEVPSGLREALTASKWVYMGFCPCKPLTRLRLLLSFPLAALEDALQTAGLEPPTMPTKVLRALKKLTPPVRAKATIMPITVECQCSDRDTPFEALRRSVENVLHILSTLKDQLLQREQHYVQVAKTIVRIHNEIIRYT
jgi:hypothetical protein